MGTMRRLFWLIFVLLLFQGTKGIVVESCSRRNIVQVTDVDLTCDSPGAYYYGSQAYRNSITCTEGDKAMMSINFTVTDQFKSDYIYMEIYLGLYGTFAKVMSAKEICSMSALSSYYDFQCPGKGDYTLKVKASVPGLREYGYHYTPDVMVKFRDDQYRRLGCGTTGAEAVNKYALQRSNIGVYIMLAAVIIFLAVFGTILYQNYKRSKILKHIAEEKEQWERQNATYVRTEENGQIYIVPKRLAISRSASQGTSTRSIDETASAVTSGTNQAMRLSNPEYNEPQLPTNPII